MSNKSPKIMKDAAAIAHEAFANLPESVVEVVVKMDDASMYYGSQITFTR